MGDLTPQQAANELRISVWAVYRLIRDGYLRAVRYREHGPLAIPTAEITRLKEKA